MLPGTFIPKKSSVLVPQLLVQGVIVLLATGASLTASSQTDFVRLKSFGNPALSAATPCAAPIEATDGNLYGTTSEGGAYDFGTIYKLSKSGTGLAILHSFAGKSNDGANPIGGLVEAEDGGLYGTTFAGGSNNLGTIFRVSKDGTVFAVLKHFTSAGEGTKPQAALFKASDNNLFGTTLSTLFKLDPVSGAFAILHTFGSPGDGSQPQAGLIESTNLTLYGTTVSGGASNLGTIFKIDKDGNNYALLFSFSETNGRSPQSTLMEGNDGLLYGTTCYRATNSYGTVFQVSKVGSNYTVLHNFTGANLDGWSPLSALMEGADGSLYGTTTNGGLEGQGTVFKLSRDGNNYSILHNFSWTNSDGRVPLSGLLKASDGALYGATSRGGSADYGSVFRMDQTGTNFTVLTSFSWSGSDGWNSQASLTEASDGFLYGTTFNGGSNDFGTVFKIIKDRTGYSVLHHFDWHSDGAFPKGTVIEGTNGALYGTAFEGGTNGYGTVFRLNKDGTGFTVLHHFSGLKRDGSHPQSSLLLASDGVLYGTTAQGGEHGWGTLFKLNQNGNNYAVVRSIDTTNFAEIQPLASLIEGSDGALYGTTSGGSGNVGTAFKITKEGNGFTNLHTFTNSSSSDGRGLYSGLVEGTNGVLFGTTFLGGFTPGFPSFGVIYSLNEDGSGFTVIHTFSAVKDSRNPSAALIKGADDRLYGVSFSGRDTVGQSVTNSGTAFSMRYDGSDYRALKSFIATQEGKNPVASLALASDGALYGTASAGGDMASGTLFSLAEPPFFTDLSLSSSGALLHLHGTSTRTYAIQATTNFAQPIWQVLPGSPLLTNSVFEFSDPASSNFDLKFYRARTK